MMDPTNPAGTQPDERTRSEERAEPRASRVRGRWPASTPPARSAGRVRGDRWRLPAVIGAGAVVGLVGGLLLSMQGNGEPGGSSASPPATAVAPPTTARPTADEIVAAVEVEETGFTTGQVIVCDTDGSAGSATGPSEPCPPEERRSLGDQVSYAAVIQNTSDQVLQTLPITVRFRTATGEVLNNDDGIRSRTNYYVGMLRPGQQIALSDTIYVEGALDITRMEAEVGEPDDWMPEADLYHLFRDDLEGDLIARDITVAYGDRHEPIVAFTIESTYGMPVNPQGAYVVFRNAAGDIVGGEWGPVLGGPVRPRGSLEGEVAVSDPMEIPGIDPARTEVHFGYHS